MDGLGQPQLISAQVPLPTTVDGVLDAIRKIIIKGGVYSVHIEKGSPILYQRTADSQELEPGADPDLGDMTPYEIARQIDMQEFDVAAQQLQDASPISVVSWMMVYLESRKLVPTHLLVGEATNFWSWIGIGPRRGAKLSTFLGVRVERDQQMPSQAFLIFGCADRWAGVENAKVVLKGAC
jgi:hypothetical protein